MDSSDIKIKTYFTHGFFSLFSENVHEEILLGFLSRARQSSRFYIRNTPKHNRVLKALYQNLVSQIVKRIR